MWFVAPFVSGLFVFLVVFLIGKNLINAIYCGIGFFIVGLILHYFFDKKGKNQSK